MADKASNTIAFQGLPGAYSELASHLAYPKMHGRVVGQHLHRDGIEDRGRIMVRNPRHLALPAEKLQNKCTIFRC